MRNKQYWGYRINKDAVEFFRNELLSDRLRQGWGFDDGQDLRNFTVDKGAGRNRSMFNNVKKGDILLVPHLPTYNYVAIVEATEDWNIGYKYEIHSTEEDYGHIFPAKYIKKFTRNNENVTGNLRSSLKNLSRFWNINHYSDDIEMLLNTQESRLSESQDHKIRLENSIVTIFSEVFNEKDFSNKLFDKLTEQFTREEWEHVLAYGLEQLFPAYVVERVGGPEEVKHGTDILIKVPGILPDLQYGIAIQIKDYEGFVANDVVAQINKSEAYYNTFGIKIIEKIVVITKAIKDENLKLVEHDKSVKFVFSNDLKSLLTEIGKNYIGIKSDAVQ